MWYSLVKTNRKESVLHCTCSNCCTSLLQPLVISGVQWQKVMNSYNSCYTKDDTFPPVYYVRTLDIILFLLRCILPVHSFPMDTWSVHCRLLHHSAMAPLLVSTELHSRWGGDCCPRRDHSPGRHSLATAQTGQFCNCVHTVIFTAAI